LVRNRILTTRKGGRKRPGRGSRVFRKAFTNIGPWGEESILNEPLLLEGVDEGGKKRETRVWTSDNHGRFTRLNRGPCDQGEKRGGEGNKGFFANSSNWAAGWGRCYGKNITFRGGKRRPTPSKQVILFPSQELLKQSSGKDHQKGRGWEETPN